jgi:hypothetical protein
VNNKTTVKVVWTTGPRLVAGVVLSSSRRVEDVVVVSAASSRDACRKARALVRREQAPEAILSVAVQS